MVTIKRKDKETNCKCWCRHAKSELIIGIRSKILEIWRTMLCQYSNRMIPKNVINILDCQDDV